MFEANLKTIEQHNQEYAKGKHTWTMGVNHLTDLTHEEFMKLNQLKVPQNVPKKKTSYKMQAKSLAAAVDWRDKVIVTFSVITKHIIISLIDLILVMAVVLQTFNQF